MRVQTAGNGSDWYNLLSNGNLITIYKRSLTCCFLWEQNSELEIKSFQRSANNNVNYTLKFRCRSLTRVLFNPFNVRIKIEYLRNRGLEIPAENDELAPD